MSWKSVEFKGSDSVERVERLQALCSDTNRQSDSSIDAILVVGGIDSFHSQVCQAVLKYLFLGGSGQELLGEQVISQERERLEDVVLLIRRHTVSIFYSSESDAAVTILPVISKWRNVSEFVVHDGMDLDEQEARKIAAFKRMVADIPRIGVPFGTDKHGDNLRDVMVPEKWPLVQSYGLEEDGSRGRGFFTTNHSVVNVSSELTALMAQLDAYTSRRVVTESEPLLSHHFGEFLRKLDHAESPDVRSKWSESELADDLLSFYEFGTTQYAARGLLVAPTRGAKVFYGTRSDSMTLKSSSSAFIAALGPTPDQPATHMLVQAEDPFSGVRVARTYFLATGNVCKRIIDSDALVQQHQGVRDSSHSTDTENEAAAASAKDTRLLIALYSALLRAFKASMDMLLKQLSHSLSKEAVEQLAQSSKAAAVGAMLKTISHSDDLAIQTHLVELSHTIKDQLRVTIEAVNACGRATDVQANGWHLVYYSLKLANISSASAAGNASLGSLVVGDSLLLRKHKEATGDGLCITKAFPYFRSWTQPGVESAAKEALNSVLQSEFMLQAPGVQLGKVILPLDMDTSVSQGDQGAKSVGAAPASTSGLDELSSAMLLLDAEEMPVVRGTMRTFTGGFLFKCPHFNPLLVSFARHVESFHLVPSEHEELVLLTLYLRPDARNHSTPLSETLPFPVETSCVRIPLLSSTRFQAEILHSLSTWKATASGLNIPFYRPHDLVAQQFDGETPRDTELKKYELPQVTKDACAQLVSKQRHVGGDAATLEQLFPPDYIPKDPSMNTTLPKPNATERTRLCVPVTVMLGVPGSDVDGMSRSICEIASASFDWSHVHVDLRKSATNQSTQFEARLYAETVSTFSEVLSRVADGRELLKLPPRVMLAVTGYVDPITVACAVRKAAASASIGVKLSAVIACVSATSAYVPDPKQAQTPFPKLFDQMAAGFTTHILLTNTAEVSSAQLQRLRYHIDQCNPFADAQVLSYHVFESPMAPLLAVDRFESVYYQRYRETHYPKWDEDHGKQLSWAKYVAELDPHECPETYRFRLVPGMMRSKFVDMAVRVLTPFATLGKALESVHPLSADTKTPTGIRLAQSIAAEKVELGAGLTDASSAKSELFTTKACPSAWCVEGRVMFEDDPTTVFEYMCSGSHARLRESSVGSGALPPLELSVTGMGINTSKLHQLLLSCYALADPVKQQMRSRLSVTVEEKRELQKEHAMDPLPDGYMFDGVNYVDFFGGRYEFHPNMPQFIEQHVATSNDAAQAANLMSERAHKSEQDFVTPIA